MLTFQYPNCHRKNKDVTSSVNDSRGLLIIEGYGFPPIVLITEILKNARAARHAAQIIARSHSRLLQHLCNQLASF